MIAIPFSPSIPEQELTVQVGDSQYVFRALWNARAGSAGLWFMDIRELDGTPIVSSVAIVGGCFLGRRSTHRLFREGAFIATSVDENDAALDTLGASVLVEYFPTAELLVSLADAGLIE